MFEYLYSMSRFRAKCKDRGWDCLAEALVYGKTCCYSISGEEVIRTRNRTIRASQDLAVISKYIASFGGFAHCTGLLRSTDSSLFSQLRVNILHRSEAKPL